MLMLMLMLRLFMLLSVQFHADASDDYFLDLFHDTILHFTTHLIGNSAKWGKLLSELKWLLVSLPIVKGLFYVFTYFVCGCKARK